MKKNIPSIVTDKPYSEEIITKVKSFNPDVMVLISGFGIIKKSLLNLAQHGVISYHHGNMRKYRGQTPVFWELYNNENEMGMTVQKLSAGLDCGEAIVEKRIQIDRSDTLKSLKNKAYNESSDMMYNAICLLENNNFIPNKITKYGKKYTIPNLSQWLLFNLKIAYRLMRYRLRI